MSAKLPAVNDIVKIRVLDEDPSGQGLRATLLDYDCSALVSKNNLSKKRWEQRAGLYNQEMRARVLQIDSTGRIDLFLK